VEDTGVVALRWRNGALGTMNVTMLTYPANFESSITVIGEKGTVRLGGKSANQVQHWQFADGEGETPAGQDDGAASSEPLPSGHALYYQNVIRVLRGQSDPETDGREGLKSLELLVAIYKSARDGNRVALPLDY
jgi:UDP-N-acetyl-2-amino-2-deoxyglucuronate dehydrogenase